MTELVILLPPRPTDGMAVKHCHIRFFLPLTFSDWPNGTQHLNQVSALTWFLEGGRRWDSGEEEAGQVEHWLMSPRRYFLH